LFHLKLNAHSSSDLIFRRDGRTINKSSPFALDDRHTGARFIQQSSYRVEGFDWRGVGEIAGRRTAEIEEPGSSPGFFFVAANVERGSWRV
jgi:hypothetical protein